MNSWTWVLTGLCIAGVLLPVVALAPVLANALRLRARVQELQHARLFTSLESLQLQQIRLQQLAQQAIALQNRIRNAVRGFRAAAAGSGAQQMRESMRSAGAEISSLLSVLR